jgi:hypothetical protein
MPPSSFWRRNIELKAKSMLLSDEETFKILNNYYTQKSIVIYPTCLLCNEVVNQVFPMNGCQKHLICSDCTEHAELSNVLQCSFCPIPTAEFDVQCPICSVQFITTSLDTTCPNHHSFHVNLLRSWKRGENTYTNYLKEEEKHWIRKEFEEYPTSIHCPTCRTPLERSSACNELYHCGHECVCNACGQFSFRWENGLHQHRQESGCASHVDVDSEVKLKGEGACIFERKKKIIDNFL